MLQLFSGGKHTVGIIDTLSAGFDRVTRRLWLVVIPVLVDIGIWIGPKLSIGELVQKVVVALPTASDVGDQYQQTWAFIQAYLTNLGSHTNILTFLSLRLLGLPSLTGNFTPKAVPFAAAQRLIEIPTWPALLGTAILLTMLSLFISCFCLSLIAQEVREEELDIPYVLQTTWRSWLRVVTLLSVMLLLTAMMTSGVGILAALLSLISQELSWLILNLFTWGALLVGVYIAIILFFTLRAIVLDDIGIVRALWHSFNVVHRNFLATIGFILLINIVQTGLLYIWRMLATNVMGTAVGIIGNAYVGTGLVVASFIFYRDRFVAWQQSRMEEGK
ncbi:MAG: hypothetical protein H5T68_06830 [Chloroflexi bacterium]|nr:hypothetical protein [Chloroflexota bacterium]